MSKKRVARVVNFILVPIISAIFCYGFVYITCRPFIDQGVSIMRMMLLDDTPKFDIDNSVSASKKVKESGDFPKIGERMGDLTADSVQLKTPIFYGDSNEILDQGAGQYTGSVYPGEVGTTMFSGHNNLEFGKLIGIKPGAKITLKTTYGTFEYEVVSAEVLNKDSYKINDMLYRKSGRNLLLYTCYPRNAFGITDQRYFCFAKRISGPEITEN